MAVPDEQAPAGLRASAEHLVRSDHLVDADRLVASGRVARSLLEGSGN